MSKPLLWAELKRLLDEADFEGIMGLHRTGVSIVRHLISMTYDKDNVRSWRAMEAIGRVTSLMDREEGRAIIQRMLWMMREESGTNPWSAGEIIAEVLHANPGQFDDIVPIVISFHEEPILRIGSLWSIIRLAGPRGPLVRPFAHVPALYASSPDATERGFSALALDALGQAPGDTLERLCQDHARFKHYDGETLAETTVAEVAARALARVQ